MGKGGGREEMFVNKEGICEQYSSIGGRAN